MRQATEFQRGTRAKHQTDSLRNSGFTDEDAPSYTGIRAFAPFPEAPKCCELRAKFVNACHGRTVESPQTPTHQFRMKRLFYFTVCVIALQQFSTQAFSADWNQWRGPNRDSKIESADWPERLNGSMEQVWASELGPTYSGPIVSGDLVFTTETVDKKFERVSAFNLNTGEQVWTKVWEGAMAVPFFAAKNGDWIRSTPACDGNNLIVLGMRDVLVCLDPKTGTEKWRVDFPLAMGTPIPSFGAVCSPLIDGDSVYVQTGGALVRIKNSNGEVVWKSLEKGGGMMSNGAFSSPVIATLCGQRQLVVQTRTELCGVNLDSGGVLWKQPIEAFRGMNILTPLVSGDRIFTAAHSGRSQLFEIRKQGDNWSVTEVWAQKPQGYMSSPVLIDGTIYLHQKNQRLSALSIADGKILWTTRPQGEYWSIVANGKKLLALTNDGKLSLIQSSDEGFSPIDSQTVAKDSWAHLAVQGDKIIVRDLNELKVFSWK